MNALSPSARFWRQRWPFAALAVSVLLTGCATDSPAEQAVIKPSLPPTPTRVPEQVRPDIYPEGAQAEPEPVVRYGRYTLVSTSPRAEQRDLLSQIIDVTIPSTMNPSVHDAMSYVLQHSGYRLCPAQGDVQVLYGLPLPASQAQLGPMTLRNTIQILAGPAWQVSVDEVARRICFAQRPGYERVASSDTSLRAPGAVSPAVGVAGGAQ